MAIKTVEVFRKIRDEHYRILKGKSYEERLKYYRRKAHSFRTKIGRLIKKQVASL